MCIRDRYQFILKEKEHYRKIKEEIRAKSKKAADKITAEQRKEILKEGKDHLFAILNICVPLQINSILFILHSALHISLHIPPALP